MYDEIQIGNPYFIQTIKLLEFLDELKTSVKTNKSFNVEEKIDTCLPKIEYPKKPINIIHNKYTNDSIEELLRKILILILTHAGYHNADQDCFSLMNDLLKSYLKNLTSLFRKKIDQEILLKSSIEQNENELDLCLLKKTFMELGFSFEDLQKFNDKQIFYRNHILTKINDMKLNTSTS